MPIDILEQTGFTTEEKIRGLRFHIIHQTLVAKLAKRQGEKQVQFDASLKREYAISATNQLKENGKLK